jgi:gluconolactonase
MTSRVRANGGLDPASFAPLEAEQFAAPTRIANTFTLAEGPVWDHCEKQLLFTDAEARKVHKLTEDGAIGVYYQPTNYANGLAFDFQGQLLMAEMGGGKGGRITRLDRALKLTVVVDRDPNCALLNTTDDLAVRSDGTLYFTDPVVAHGGYFGLSLSPKPIYRFKPGGTQTTLREGQANLPNGIRLSPDESKLYAVGYLDGKVFRFDVAADGSLSGSVAIASGLSSPDSMCVDAAGNLYVGVSGGLQVLRPDGSPVTLIPISSSSGTTNCAFGGDDGKTLFITAWTSLWRVDAAPIPGNDWARNRAMPCD